MSCLSYPSKCFACGFSLCFPGLSGAGTASLLGIYGDLLDILPSFLRHPAKNAAKLFLTLVSVLSGVTVFYLIFSDAAGCHPKAFLYAGSLISAFSLPFYLSRSALVKTRFTFSVSLFALIGAFLPYAEKLFTADRIVLGTSSDPLLLILCGVFLSVSLLLPGISFSYMLSFLGLYGKLITDIKQKEFTFPFLIGLGAAVGTVAFSSLISRFVRTHEAESDGFVISFIVSSLINSFI